MSRFCFLCVGCGTKHSRCRAGSSRANRAAASRRKEKGMEEWSGALADAPFSGATWLELANRRCENRIPQSVSLVNPLFANFFAKLLRRRGFCVFSTFCPKNSLSAGRKPTCFLLLFKVVLAIIITQDFVDRFLFLSTPCSKGCRRRQHKTVSPPENRPDRAVFQRLIS